MFITVYMIHYVARLLVSYKSDNPLVPVVPLVPAVSLVPPVPTVPYVPAIPRYVASYHMYVFAMYLNPSCSYYYI